MTTELAHIAPDPIGDIGARPAKKPNPSWFKPGDVRINRKGRPRRTTAAKPLSGPLVRLVMPCQYVTSCHIRGRPAPHLDSLPHDMKVVDAHFDPERYAVVLTLWHPNFAHVAEGQPLPEYMNWQYRLRCPVNADWLPQTW